MKKRTLRNGEDPYTMESTVLLAQPLLDRVLAYFFSAIFVTLLLFAFFTEYARTESARGEIAAASGFSTVVAEHSAIVVELLVEPGEPVRAGDALARFSRPRIMSGGNDTYDLSVEQMQEGLRTFDQRITDNHDAIAATRRQIEAVRQGAAISTVASVDRYNLIRERRSVASDRLAALEELATEGMVTAMAVDRARAQSLQIMQEAADAELQRNEIQRGRDERVAALEAQVRSISQNTLALEAERLATQKQLKDLQAEHSFTVVAPTNGVVAAVPVRPGQRIDPGQRMFAIAQPSANLTAVLEVPSRAIGLIEEGQRVSLKYDAFPFQTYGLRYGRVTRVEAASIEGGESITNEEKPTDRRFLVEVRPDEDAVVAYGRPRPLRVGMMLTADIEVERRRLLSWWLSPLLVFKNRFQ